MDLCGGGMVAIVVVVVVVIASVIVLVVNTHQRPRHLLTITGDILVILAVVSSIGNQFVPTSNISRYFYFVTRAHCVGYS